MANSGRKSKIQEDKFLIAVQKKRTLSDNILADALGVTRMSVWNYKKNNPEVVKRADDWLISYTNMDFNNRITMDIFENLPEVKDWVQMQTNRQVSDEVISDRKRSLYNVCMNLKTAPLKLNVDMVSDLVNDMKNRKRTGVEVPKGLSYTVIRDAIRSFFTLELGISGELLSAKGVDMSATEGSGLLSQERITKEERARMEENINLVFDKLHAIHPDSNLDYDIMKVETLAYCKFMYYTATRGTASLQFKLSNPQSEYNTKMWVFHLKDKGKKGGKWWDKILIDEALEEFKQYLVKRFGLEYSTLEQTAKNIDYPFPVIRRYAKLTIMLKVVHKRSGKVTKIPTHIFRHTFAQDALDATDHNYELVASIGGWDSTTILKKHYGAMSDSAKVKGLRRMMGLKVDEVEKPLVLKW